MCTFFSGNMQGANKNLSTDDTIKESFRAAHTANSTSYLELTSSQKEVAEGGGKVGNQTK